MKNVNIYHYPIGKLRVQPVGIIIFAAVMATLVGLVAAVLADKYYWWIDPTGAIILALYTIINWSKTVMEKCRAGNGSEMRSSGQCRCSVVEDHYAGDYFRHLRVLGGCLCVFGQADTNAGSMDMWVMREYDAGNSWTKLFKLKVFQSA
ncbi:hypothetical protein J5N97_001959 [Dioscorea zingiberensis]|uniref:Uncharacterized protein n=1 Tax=Dioscorea zingiberensis TaxID=325984 RepID=A0A9D5BT45_9LILI|nr:hypothetical protein J5N97_001959 [Dioscorea zingiberensis]